MSNTSSRCSLVGEMLKKFCSPGTLRCSSSLLPLACEWMLEPYSASTQRFVGLALQWLEPNAQRLQTLDERGAYNEPSMLPHLNAGEFGPMPETAGGGVSAEKSTGKALSGGIL